MFANLRGKRPKHAAVSPIAEEPGMRTTRHSSGTQKVINNRARWKKINTAMLTQDATSGGKEKGKKPSPEEYAPRFGSFVPRVVQHQVACELDRSGMDPQFDGRARSFVAAVLFADASGFTALTESLAKDSSGAEKMCHIINEFFTVLITVIEKYGGDVIKFSGDALTVIFPVLPPGGIPNIFNRSADLLLPSKSMADKMRQLQNAAAITAEIEATYSKSLEDAAARATQCSIELHQKVAQFSRTSEGGSELSLHACVGCGTLTGVHIGGIFGRYEYVIAGSPMDQIAEAEHRSKRDMTVLAPAATAQLAAWIGDADTLDEDGNKIEMQQPGNGKAPAKWEGYVDVRSLKRPIAALPKTAAPAPVTPEIVGLLQRYIPVAVGDKLRSGHTGLIAELREVSVLFICVDGIDLTAEANGGLEGANALGQHLMLEIQKSVFLFQGSINKMSYDDKGLITIAVFGLPPLPHDDDPRRAVHAAMSLAANLPEALGDDVTCSIGITSGQAFCGVIGSKSRREYTVMGDMVNLAARLMATAGKLGKSVIVDENTYKMSRDNFGYEQPDSSPMKMKGKAKPVKFFQPTEDKEDTEIKQVMGIMGRRKERVALRNMVGSLSTFAYGGVLLVTGDHGSGRPALNLALHEIATEAGMTFLRKPRKAKKEKHKGVSRVSSMTGSSLKGARPTKMGSSTSLSGLGNAMTLLTTQPEQKGSDAVDGESIERMASSSKLAELKSHVSALEADFLEGPKYSAWTAILDTMFEHIAADKKLDVSNMVDRLALVDILLEMLPAHQRMHASYLNKMIPLLDDSIPSQLDAEQLNEQQISQHLGDMILNLIKKFAEHRDVIVTLHLQTGTETRKKVDASSWELALTFAKWLKKRAMLAKTMLLGAQNLRTLILCITSSPLIEQDSMPLDQINLLHMAEESGTALQLQPFDRHTRDMYMVEVLKTEHKYQRTLQQTHCPLLDFVSDYASGMPKYVEELLVGLFKQKSIEIHELDLAYGGMRGLNITNDLLKEYSTETFDTQDIDDIIKFPKKMVNAALSKYERLDANKKEILKLASVCNHFSVQMLRELQEENASQVQARGSFTGGGGNNMFAPRGSELSDTGVDDEDMHGGNHTTLDGELAELIKLSVLDPLPGVDAVKYVQLHDPQAKAGFTFQCKLMQLEVKKLLTQTNRDKWEARLEQMQEEAVHLKQNFLRQQTRPKVPFALRGSAMFRAGAIQSPQPLDTLADENFTFYEEEQDTIAFDDQPATQVLQTSITQFEEIVDELVGDLEKKAQKTPFDPADSLGKFKQNSITLMASALTLINHENRASMMSMNPDTDSGRYSDTIVAADGSAQAPRESGDSLTVMLDDFEKEFDLVKPTSKAPPPDATVDGVWTENRRLRKALSQTRLKDQTMTRGRRRSSAVNAPEAKKDPKGQKSSACCIL